MAKRKTKYTMRPDGRIVLSKMYDGQRKYFYGSSDAEVERKQREYEAERGKAALKLCRTLREVADVWWEDKQHDISPNSINSYRVAYERAVETFGDTPVNEITPALVYRYLKGFQVKGYSQKVITKTQSVLKGILDYSIIEGEIDANPCLNLPALKGKAGERRPPASLEDIAKLEACKEESLLARMFYFLAYTGLRRGEVIALQWKHIDLTRKIIRVEQSCAYLYNYKPVIKKPKTDAGIRTVSLLDNVIAVLPAPGAPDDYVFFPDGLPYQTTLERHLRKFRTEHDITATLHQLRHSFATLGHSAGIDAKDMQSELGHASITMTLDVYTGEDEAHRAEVREQLNDYVQKRINVVNSVVRTQ